MSVPILNIHWKDKWILIEWNANPTRLKYLEKVHYILGKKKGKEFIASIDNIKAQEKEQLMLWQGYHLAIFRVRADILKEPSMFKRENLEILEDLIHFLNSVNRDKQQYTGDKTHGFDKYYNFERLFKKFKENHLLSESLSNYKNPVLLSGTLQPYVNFNSDIIESLQKYIATLDYGHIKCILLEGSLNNGTFVKGWSDIDIWTIISDEALDNKNVLFSLIGVLKKIECFIEERFEIKDNFKAHPHIRYLFESETSLFFTLFPVEKLGIRSGYRILYGNMPKIFTGYVNKKRLMAEFIGNFYRASSQPSYFHLGVIKNLPRMYFLIKGQENIAYSLKESMAYLENREWNKKDVFLFKEMLNIRSQWKRIDSRGYIFKALPSIYKLIGHINAYKDFTC